MPSLRFLVALLFGLLLAFGIRPSSSMPIEGAKNSDKYAAIYNLIAQRLQNLSQVDQESDQNIRRTFIPETKGIKTGASLVSRNQSDLNSTTVPLRIINQKNQTIHDQNNRRSYVPSVAGYTGNTLAGNRMAGNPLAGVLLAGNRQMTNFQVGNQMTGNFLERSQLAGNPPLTTQLAGNIVAGKQQVGNQLVGNQSPGKQLAGVITAGNRPMGEQLTGSLAGILSTGNPSSKDQPVGNPSTRNLLDGILSASGVNGTKQISNYSTNLGDTGASMFPTSLNDGLTSKEDQSGIITNVYRQQSNLDRKNTIYWPPPGFFSPEIVENFRKVSGQSSAVKKTDISQQSYPHIRNLQKPMDHSKLSYQRYSSFPWYSSYQQQGWKRGYPASPGYQVNYPGMMPKSAFPVVKGVRDRVPADQEKNVQVTSYFRDNDKAMQGKFHGMLSPQPSSMQMKLPIKTVTKSTTPFALPNDIPTSGSGSSGSGFDESYDMDDTADLKEPEPEFDDTADLKEPEPEFSESGSGYDEKDFRDDISKVAFMLAGTNDNPNMPPFPVPGLPMNLTRQQAIDIYKSALYFAGLLQGDDSNDIDKAGSGDEAVDEGTDDDDSEDDDETISDNDVKEALAASSGELIASGQEISDAEASGSESELPIEKSDSKDNDVVQGDDDKTKIDSEKLASEPQKEVKEAQAIDKTSNKADSDSVKDEEDGQKGQNEEEQPETVEDIDADVPPPLDSDTQRSDSAAQENENPPIDDTKQMTEVQSKYAADQQQEKALAYLANTRQSGVFSAPSQRAIICKDTIQKISCPPEHRIRVLNADFGDMGDVGCLKENNPMPVGFCRTPGTYEKVKKRCDGLEGCDLAASNDWFGDACPDANKYLDVNYDCVNNPASEKREPPAQPIVQSSPGPLQSIIQLPQFIFQVPYPAPPAAGFSQASYQPPPAPAAYAPAPYAQPPPAYAPGMGVPDLMSSSPYMAPPDPCSPCNTCAQCSLPVCSPCTHTCQPLTCAPRIPASLQPLWQQWNERTADMSRMEMAALIISPLPKLAAPTKAPESAQVSGGAEGSESASGETTSDLDEDALYEASKRSKIQQVKSKQTAKKVTLATHKKAHKDDSEQGFLRSSDLLVSSGDASSGSSS